MKKLNLPISTFNNNISQYLHEVEEGTVITITSRNRPIVVLIRKQDFDLLIGKVVSMMEAE